MKIYNSGLHESLKSEALRKEIMNLTLEDKWKNEYVSSLEDLEDGPIDDKTKRQWLTATLQSNKDMTDILRQRMGM